jgi:hypothetical protein
MIPALRWIWGMRTRPLLALGLLAILGCAAAHQFLLLAGLGLLLLLAGYITWDELFDRAARPFHLALVVALLFWVGFGLVITDWGDGQTRDIARGLARLGYQLARVPDFIGVVVRPWARAIPHLGAALFVLCAAAMFRMARSNEPKTNERVLMVLFLVLLMAASGSHPPRQETRYVFNLYAIAIVIALATIARLAERLAKRPATAAGLTTLAALGGFAMSEDFQPHHLLEVDQPAEAFRLNMTPGMQSHLVIREDYRSLAGWLQGHVPSNGLVVFGTHGLDHYYPDVSYFYVDEHDSNFRDWSCRGGTIERWANHPLLYSPEMLIRHIAPDQTAYLVAFSYDPAAVLAPFASLHPVIEATFSDAMIVKLTGPPAT